MIFIKKYKVAVVRLRANKMNLFSEMIAYDDGVHKSIIKA